jgi:plasmid stabilization system protein ParE
MPPRPFRVVFDALARRDLANVFDYISIRAGSVVAERFATRLYRHCVSLGQTPERGTRRDELRPGLRTVGYRRRATILFQVIRAKRTVLILGIYYGGRNYTDDFGIEGD